MFQMKLHKKVNSKNWFRNSVVDQTSHTELYRAMVNEQLIKLYKGRR